MDHAVVAENVCKEYRLYPGSISRLKEALSRDEVGRFSFVAGTIRIEQDVPTLFQ